MPCFPELAGPEVLAEPLRGPLLRGSVGLPGPCRNEGNAEGHVDNGKEVVRLLVNRLAGGPGDNKIIKSILKVKEKT